MKREKIKAPERSTRKKVLGRGLDALFPDMGDHAVDNKTAEYFLCDIQMIHPNPMQPRSRFSEAELSDLSRSIQSQGILQPLVVRKSDVGYELIAGERRLRASKLAGISQVPVIIKQVSDTELLEMSIVENIQRENLNPMEEAEAYRRLMDEFQLTQDEVAGRVGKSRSAVANFLRLCQLPDPIKTSLREGELSMGHARALLGAGSTAQQTAAWRTVVAKQLSVRETEALINRLKKGERKRKKSSGNDSDTVYFASVADNLSRQYGTKVLIHRKGGRGKVEIEFYSDADLDRLLGLLNKE